MDRIITDLIEIIDKQSDQNNPLVIGLTGPQGSGKTTLSSKLSNHMNAIEKRCQVLSLDDFYYDHTTQIKLYESSGYNPLYQYRGLPGTHDIDLLVKCIESLVQGKPTLLPIYDKSLNQGRGDRVGFTSVEITPNVIILEGWCLGFKPISLNSSHLNGKFCGLYSIAQLDPINESLKMYESMIYPLINYFIILRIECIEWVYEWRFEQELKSNRSQLEYQQVCEFVDRFMVGYELYYDHLKHGVFGDVKKEVFIDLDKNRNPILNNE